MSVRYDPTASSIELQVIPISLSDLEAQYPEGSNKIIEMLYQQTLKYNFYVCANQPKRALAIYENVRQLTNHLNKKEIKNV